MTMEIAERCWEKVDSSGGPSVCWPWTGDKDSDGYGRILVNGRMVQAHRIAWELTYGPIPADKPVVRHVVCRNPICCNPAHLKPGTQADNLRDMVTDGMSNRGVRNPAAKLTEAQVHEIHRCAATGESQSAIARRFGVCQPAVSLILTGRRWAWLKESA